VRAFAVAAPLWLAAIAPGLLALNLPPSPTLFNQAAAWVTWGMVATYGVRATALPWRCAVSRAALLAGALTLVAVCALASSAVGALPWALGVSGAASVAAAALLALLGTAMAPTASVPRAWFGAWLVAGLLSSVIALLQVFTPAWVDGVFIAHSANAGRAAGNLRQPNHLASLLLWAVVSLVALVELGPLSRSAARHVAAWAALAVLMLAVMLTGSRTGQVGVIVLTMWGLLDRRLSRSSRAMLLTAPLLFALAWWLVGLWVTVQAGAAVGAAQRVGQEAWTTGRGPVWRDTLALIAANPLTGVGFGEFNLAWTLTPSAARWPQFFDHTHNLPLQVLVELGLPLGGAVLALLTWALWQAWTRVRAVEGAPGAAARAAFVMVFLMGLHSQLEYPLWYAHFLLPTAFAWGLCLGAGAVAPADAAPRWPLAVGAALVLSAGVMLWDFQRVTTIFAPPEDGSPLTERIERGQHSWLFAHHADYARLTALEDIAPPTSAEFRRAKHYLLDTRLLIGWAEAYAREGDVQRARWIADRLRELKQPSAEPFFAPCADASVTVKPFQCTPASQTFSWRDFK
jgi:O-antigen ligase